MHARCLSESAHRCAARYGARLCYAAPWREIRYGSVFGRLDAQILPKVAEAADRGTGTLSKTKPESCPAERREIDMAHQVAAWE